MGYKDSERRGTMNNRKWELRTVKIEPGVKEDQETLDEVLNDGWEPFSGSASSAGHVIYFRRAVNQVDMNEVVRKLDGK